MECKVIFLGEREGGGERGRGREGERGERERECVCVCTCVHGFMLTNIMSGAEKVIFLPMSYIYMFFFCC